MVLVVFPFAVVDVAGGGVRHGTPAALQAVLEGAFVFVTIHGDEMAFAVVFVAQHLAVVVCTAHVVDYVRGKPLF